MFTMISCSQGVDEGAVPATEQAEKSATIEDASSELEEISNAVRSMISEEFADLEWKPAGGMHGRLDGPLCENPSTHAAYHAEMWSLPVRPTDEQGGRILRQFVEIGSRYGYATDRQPRAMGEMVTVDLFGPHPGSKISVSYRNGLVVNGSIGCLPRENSVSSD